MVSTNKDYVAYDGGYAKGPLKYYRELVLIYFCILLFMYVIGELSEKSNGFKLDYMLRYWAVALPISLILPLRSLFFLFSRIEFHDDGIYLFSMGKILFNIGRYACIPYDNLSVREWHLSNRDLLKIINNGRTVTNLYAHYFKDHYLQIRDLLKAKLPPERVTYFRIG